MKVLVDNCVISLSDTLQSAFKEQNLVWGDSIECIRIAGYVRKTLPSKDQAWKRDQIECLPTIGKIAQEQRIALHTYDEIIFEGWKRSGSFPGNHLGYIFSGVDFNHVDAAIERSYFFQSELSEYLKKNDVIDFCKWLLTPNIEALADKLAPTKRYPESLLKNLRSVQRFRELCTGLSEKQYPDAFHLWSAEVSGMDLFLTTDRKFIRAMTETKKLILPCMPLSPSKLLEQFGVTEREPFEHKEGQFYDFLGNPS
ncbi:MAG: hypothetical protein ACYCZR_12460 [Burkholderiales bacterium]